MTTFLLIIISILYFSWIYTSRRGIQSISSSKLKEILNDPNYYFLDVRTKNEYKTKNIMQFKNIPLGSDFSKIPMDRTVVVICQSGARSVLAYKQLKKLGYTSIVNVSGGMNSWKN